MAIQQVMPGQVVKATQINELVNFCNDVEVDLSDAINDRLADITTETVEEELDLSDIYERLNKLENDVSNLPGAMINEAAKILATFKLTVNIQG